MTRRQLPSSSPGRVRRVRFSEPLEMEGLSEALPFPSLGELLNNRNFEYNIPKMIFNEELTEEDIVGLLWGKTNPEVSRVAIKFLNQNGSIEDYFNELLEIFWSQDDPLSFGYLLEENPDMFNPQQIVQFVNAGYVSPQCFYQLSKNLSFSDFQKYIFALTNSQNIIDQRSIEVSKLILTSAL